MYGLHSVAQDPRQLPDKLDGIFLETGGNNYVDQPLEVIDRFKKGFFSSEDLVSMSQYTKLFKPLEERQIPVYFADLCLTDLNAINLLKTSLSASFFAEGVVGLYSMINLYGRAMKIHEISRRDLLKLVLGLWGLSGVNAISRVVPALADTSKGVHPEITALQQAYQDKYNLLVKTIREVAISHKLGWLIAEFRQQSRAWNFHRKWT